MQSIIFNKFNFYIHYPDLANKFILTTYKSFKVSEKFSIYLKYIFSQHTTYNYMVLKALIMMSSIFPKRCLISSRLIIIKFGLTRCHSIIFLKLSFNQGASFLNYYNKKPTNINTMIQGHIRESKHFLFPGFIKHLRLPHWKRFVNISFNQPINKDLYPLFFRKISYID